LQRQDKQPEDTSLILTEKLYLELRFENIKKLVGEVLAKKIQNDADLVLI
jgi:hypothetical protein